jgi:hypothetical protein
MKKILGAVILFSIMSCTSKLENFVEKNSGDIKWPDSFDEFKSGKKLMCS